MTSKIIYEICIDFDAVNWADEPDFSQEYDHISGDVDTDGINFLGWNRGKQREEGNAPAAICEIRLKPGLCEKYSPFTTGVLAGKIRPWLPVRIRTYFKEEWRSHYFGYLSRITINPEPSIQSVVLYCTDGTDLLARQKVAQDPNSKTLCSDGGAMEVILDAAGWSASRRNIDKDGGEDLLGYPATTEY
jgi:hypothetical protein